MEDKKGKRTIILFIIFLLTCAILWHIPPFSHYTRPSRLRELFLILENSPYLYPSILLAFIIAGITMFPITGVITATTLLVGIKKGLILSIIGCFLSATFTFFGIRFLGSKAKDYLLSKKKIQKLNKIITEEGIVTIMILRIIPIGYTLISVTAALSDISFSKYIVGTMLGVLPDLLLCIFVAGTIHNILFTGNVKHAFLIFIVVIIFVIFWSFLLKKFISKYKKIDLE